MKRRLPILLLLCALVVGCDAIGKLFEAKGSGTGGSNTTASNGVDEDDGLVGTEDAESGSHTAAPTAIMGKIHPEDVVFPKGARVGDWIKLRRTQDDEKQHEEWAVIGKQGDLLWVEHVASPQESVAEVTWYLVGPDGKTRMAVKGVRGETPGGSLTVDEGAPSGAGIFHLLAAGEKGEATAKIPVGSKTVEGSRVEIEDGEAYVDDGPFGGLLRLVYGEDDEQLIVELVARGTDRKPQMKGGLPRYDAGR